MKQRHAVILSISTLLLVLAVASASAGPVWICSNTRAVECGDDGTVDEPDLGGLKPVTFMRVDSTKMEITLLAPPERAGEVTVIDNALKEEGIWVFTGIENGRAWSMVISDEGYMTLSVTYDGVTWSVFGHSVVEDLD